MTSKLDKSIEALSKSAELEPDNLVTLTTLGEVHAASGDLDKAMEIWEKALSVKPDSVFPMYNLGLAHFQKGDREKAVELWEKCISIDPSYVPAYKNLAAASAMAGDLDAAVRRWESLATMMPGSPEPGYGVGRPSLQGRAFRAGRGYVSSAGREAPGSARQGLCQGNPIQRRTALWRDPTGSGQVR